MPADKHVDVLDLGDEARELVAECQLNGRRTLFERDGRPVSILVSYDEYLALRETIDITNDAPLRDRIVSAGEEIRRGAMLLIEDLLEDTPAGADERAHEIDEHVE